MRIRRGLTSRLLLCGCLAGVYETYRGEVVVIVDAHHAQCADPSHADGTVLPATLLHERPDVRRSRVNR